MAESLTRKAYSSRHILTRSCKEIEIEVDSHRMKVHVKKEFESSMLKGNTGKYVHRATYAQYQPHQMTANQR